MLVRTNEDDFRRAGGAFWNAWVILTAGCEFPPSLEVFEHELRQMRQRSDRMVSLDQCADAIARNYRRHAL